MTDTVGANETADIKNSSNTDVDEFAPVNMTPQERVAYILEVRKRVQAGEETSSDELARAIRLIHLNRAMPSGNKKATKEPAKQVALSDF